MEHARPRHLSRRRVEQLLSKVKPYASAGSRIEILTRQFLGSPYQFPSLIGSSDTPEVFTVSFDTFDCVTYVEVVLALARASSVDDFTGWLRRIRYQGGRISWARRNHYMTAWIRSNTRAGALRSVRWPELRSVTKERTLNVVRGLPPVRSRFRCIPRRAINTLARRLETGDLIFFASVRQHLDVFHCGVIICKGENILLRHASRRAGGVVEQDLNDFLKANRMSGVIIARPKELPS
jgi:hypothetical protein